MSDLTADQVIPFLRSAIASGEPITSQDVDVIEAAFADRITKAELADVLGWQDGYDGPLEVYEEKAASIFRDVNYKRRRSL